MQEGTFTAPGYRRGTICPEPDVFAADCPTRLLLDRIADKWSVLVLTVLGEGEVRFNGLKRRIGGISQKMLSQTLRSLERDGLVVRTVTPTVPVSVSYATTALGCELLRTLRGMVDWAERRMDAVAQAQAAYDERERQLAQAVG